MKVVCLVNKWGKYFQVGEIYETINTYSAPHNGKDYWYHQFEHTGSNIGFRVECFAQISDIDETELVTEEFNEKYCVPVNNPV